jgi:hypothetical protein
MRKNIDRSCCPADRRKGRNEQPHLPGDRNSRYIIRRRRRGYPHGLSRATETTRGRDGFEVQSVRGQLENGAIAHFQVTLKVGFRLEGA